TDRARREFRAQKIDLIQFRSYGWPFLRVLSKASQLWCRLF
ncbi:unnamed protein product, partial [Brassica napus]